MTFICQLALQNSLASQTQGQHHWTSALDAQVLEHENLLETAANHAPTKQEPISKATTSKLLFVIDWHEAHDFSPLNLQLYTYVFPGNLKLINHTSIPSFWKDWNVGKQNSSSSKHWKMMEYNTSKKRKILPHKQELENHIPQTRYGSQQTKWVF